MVRYKNEEYLLDVYSKKFNESGCYFVNEDSYKKVLYDKKGTKLAYIRYGSYKNGKTYIKGICVEETYRQRGIAKYIIAKVLKEAEMKNCYKVALDPHARGGMDQTQLEKFYKNFSYGENKQIEFEID